MQPLLAWLPIPFLLASRMYPHFFLRRIGRLFQRTLAPTQVKYRCNSQDVALVLLHGFFGNTEATWARFTTFLVNEPKLTSWDLFGLGYPTSLRIDVPNVWSADPDVKMLARALKTTLSLPPLNRYRKIAIAAHSMGGLVIQRAILDNVALKNRFSHVFLFGTPSAGLAKARLFARLKRQVSDMAADGPFITSLRREWMEQFAQGMGFELYVVAGDMDEFVPASSSLAPFPYCVQAVVPGNRSKSLSQPGLIIKAFYSLSMR